jgi:hypothetical protein
MRAAAHACHRLKALEVKGGPARCVTARLVELRGIELEGQELSDLDEEAIPLPPSRR